MNNTEINSQNEDFKLEELATATTLQAKALAWDSGCRLFSPSDEEK